MFFFKCTAPTEIYTLALHDALPIDDPTEHVVVGGRNVALMEELGLTEFLADFDTLAGPVDAAVDMLRRLEAMGVSTFIAALPGHAAPLETIRGLAQARSMM